MICLVVINCDEKYVDTYNIWSVVHNGQTVNYPKRYFVNGYVGDDSVQIEDTAYYYYSSNHGDDWGYLWPGSWTKVLQGVPEDQVKIEKIDRVTEDYYIVPLNPGDDANYFDEAIIVKISNPTSFYLYLEVEEKPKYPAKDLIKPPRDIIASANVIYVRPGDHHYIFTHQYGSTGEVVFKLLTRYRNIIEERSFEFTTGGCLSGCEKDCGNGIWFGFAQDLSGYGGEVVVGGESLTLGELFCLGKNCPTTPWPLITITTCLPSIGLGGGLIGGFFSFGYIGGLLCFSAECVEDFQGTSTGVSAGVGALKKLGGGVSFGDSFCVLITGGASTPGGYIAADLKCSTDVYDLGW